jgi:hypothetical protein
LFQADTNQLQKSTTTDLPWYIALPVLIIGFYGGYILLSARNNSIKKYRNQPFINEHRKGKK